MPLFDGIQLRRNGIEEGVDLVFVVAALPDRRLGENYRRAPAKKGASATRRVLVWATYPRGPFGRFVGFVFTRLLDGIEKDREHTRTELRHLKRVIEADESEGIPEGH